MLIHLIAISYSCFDERGTGLWNSSERYLQAGAERLLLERDFTVIVERIQLDKPYADIFQACIVANQMLARAVQRALVVGAFPLVLSGTCDSSLGVLSGMDQAGLGIVWCDAHGDLNTPETSPSGEFIGMPLAIATGHCYQELWAQLGNNKPVADSQVLLVDVRDLDPLERVSIESAAIPVFEVNALQQPDETIAGLDEFAAHVSKVYLHLDIDMLDPQEAPGVNFRAPRGPSLQETEQAIQTLGSHVNLQAALMTSYNPDLDQEDKTLQSGLRLLVQIAESVRASRNNVKALE